MSNIILNCFKYILGYLWLYLANSKSTKSISKGTYIIAANIRNTYAGNIYIGSTCAVNASIRCASIKSAYIRDISIRNTFVESVQPKILTGLRIILTNPEVNNCCF